jgi:hypothetical protein
MLCRTLCRTFQGLKQQSTAQASAQEKSYAVDFIFILSQT